MSLDFTSPEIQALFYPMEVLNLRMEGRQYTQKRGVLLLYNFP